jgi:hypothetical protein
MQILHRTGHRVRKDKVRMPFRASYTYTRRCFVISAEKSVPTKRKYCIFLENLWMRTTEDCKNDHNK